MVRTGGTLEACSTEAHSLAGERLLFFSAKPPFWQMCEPNIRHGYPYYSMKYVSISMSLNGLARMATKNDKPTSTCKSTSNWRRRGRNDLTETHAQTPVCTWRSSRGSLLLRLHLGLNSGLAVVQGSAEQHDVWFRSVDGVVNPTPGLLHAEVSPFHLRR